jgi:hypothetical protein
VYVRDFGEGRSLASLPPTSALYSPTWTVDSSRGLTLNSAPAVWPTRADRARSSRDAITTIPLDGPDVIAVQARD